MRYLLLLVAFAAVIAIGTRGDFRPATEKPARTADFVPLPPHLS